MKDNAGMIAKSEKEKHIEGTHSNTGREQAKGVITGCKDRKWRVERGSGRAEGGGGE